MKTRDTNRLNMTRTTNGFCDDHAADTASITDYGPIVLQSKGKVVLIDALDQIAQGTTKGVTTDTNLLRLIMEQLTFKLISGLLSLAGKTNNNTMKEAANYSLSDLKKLKKDEVDDVCEEIHDLADTNSAALVSQGIVAADITDAETAIGIYRVAMDNPRAKKIEIKEANRKIPIMISEIVADLFVKRLDPLTDTLRYSKPDYWNAYQSARENIDLGGHFTTIKGVVKNATVVPGEAVYNATVTLVPQDVLQPTLILKTGVSGEFEKEKAKFGNYSGKVTHDKLGELLIKPFELKLGKTVELSLVYGEGETG